MGDRRIRTRKAGVTSFVQGGAVTHAREWSLLVLDGSTGASTWDASTHRRAEAGGNAKATAGADGLTKRVSGIGR